MQQVFNFFKTDGYGLREFSAEWKSLTEKDKEDIRSGIENGTLTY